METGGQDKRWIFIAGIYLFDREKSDGFHNGGNCIDWTYKGGQNTSRGRLPGIKYTYVVKSVITPYY